MTEPGGPGGIDELEKSLGRLLGVGVALSTIALGAGLVTALAGGSGAAATWLLTSGLLVLVGTPIARVAVSSIVYARRRDWLFAVLTLIVFGELLASIVAAVRHR